MAIHNSMFVEHSLGSDQAFLKENHVLPTPLLTFSRVYSKHIPCLSSLHLLSYVLLALSSTVLALLVSVAVNLGFLHPPDNLQLLHSWCSSDLPESE